MEEINTKDQIKDMRVGDERYTVPWAAVVDDDEVLWLQPTYLAHTEPRGAAQLLVSLSPGGFVVDISRCRDYTWTIPTEVAGLGYYPVVELVAVQPAGCKLNGSE